MTSRISGFTALDDVWTLLLLLGAYGHSLYLANQNSAHLMLFPMQEQPQTMSFRLSPLDAWAEITWKDGRVSRKEFYYGDSYLSQSSRSFVFKDDFESMEIIDFMGNRREITREELGN